MAVVKELIRTEENGGISFGNYELPAKSKVSEMEADTEYSVSINGEDAGKMQTNLGGKLSFSVELGGDAAVAVKVEKC